jgi:hypothetical protein
MFLDFIKLIGGVQNRRMHHLIEFETSYIWFRHVVPDKESTFRLSPFRWLSPFRCVVLSIACPHCSYMRCNAYKSMRFEVDSYVRRRLGDSAIYFFWLLPVLSDGSLILNKDDLLPRMTCQSNHRHSKPVISWFLLLSFLSCCSRVCFIKL